MNQNLWDKFFSRHSNVSFLFIVSQIIEKESNFIIFHAKINRIYQNIITEDILQFILNDIFVGHEYIIKKSAEFQIRLFLLKK